MNITSKNIIKLLTNGSERQEKILKDFEALSTDQRYEVEQLLWDAYDALFQWTQEKNLDLAMIEAELGKEAIDRDFYKKVQAKTDKEMSERFNKNTTDADLSAIRNKLEAIMSDGGNATKI